LRAQTPWPIVAAPIQSLESRSPTDVESVAPLVAGSPQHPTREAIAMAGASEAYVLAPGEGRSIDLGAFTMTVKADAGETNGVFRSWKRKSRRSLGRAPHSP
jgi:hypothetical protein